MTGGYTSDATRMYYTRQSWWQTVLEGRRSWVGPLTVDDDGRGYLEIAVPIGDETGDAIGVLKVVIGTQPLFGSIERSVIAETGHVMLLSESGAVLACPLLQPAAHNLFPGEIITERTHLNGVQAGWVETKEDTHGRSGGIVGLARVTLPADIAQAQHWSVLVSQDPAETYSPLMMLVWKLGGFWIGAVALVAWLRWRLARRIVRPIRDLIGRVHLLGHTAIADGAPIPEKVGIKEIDALATSFDELAERLERTSQERLRYVAELEQVNRDLQTSEEHYRMLWNHSVDVKILVDETGIVLDVNRRGETKLGCPASDMIGTALIEWFADSDQARLEHLVRDTFYSGQEQAAGEMNVMTITGGILIMDVDATPVTGIPKTGAVMLQLSDLTEKKALQRQLIRTERLASLSQFASMFAHDIRNPLAGIKKSLEWLGQRPELQAEPQRSWMEDVRFSADLLLGMINDMLDVYQESYSGLPLSISEVSIAKLAEEILHVFRSEAQAREVTFRLRAPTGEVLVPVDGRRLQRVLINLVHNALKYSPARGVITVTVGWEEESVSLRPEDSLGAAHRRVVISVEDEGPGIEPEELPHIFEMFLRKKDGHDYRIGRGLGLHFCRLVIDAHHGAIRAGNRSGGGAVFAVEIPVLQDQACLSR
jgi:PAS domain S-box-containing protein